MNSQSEVESKVMPRMTHAEKLARTSEKRAAILSFLASGEVWTTVEIAGQLMKTSERRTVVTLEAMERDKLVAIEMSEYAGRKLRLIGITAHGLAVADAFGAPYFEKGRTNAAYIGHHVDGQRCRLAAVAAGWHSWQPERVMRIRATRENWKKVPDAIAIDPHGAPVAIEIERHCKTPKRYAETIVSYIQEIKAGRFKYVVFVCPTGVEILVQKSMRKVTHVKFNGEMVEINTAHRARFKFCNFNTFPIPTETENG